MINDLIRNIFRFFILFLVQVLIIQDIDLGRFINLFPYVLFLLLLPFSTPGWLVLVIAFVSGTFIDTFYNTGGIHASACMFMAFTRTKLLKLFSQRDDFESNMEPTMQYLGLSGFISYAGVLIFIHHFFAFTLEVFRFSEFFPTLLRIILSTIATMIVTILIQFLFYRKRERA